MVVRGPEGLLRPYLSLGVGPSGWESRQRIPGTKSKIVTSGWGGAATASLGVEYYLRPKVAFDLGLRYMDLAGPGSGAGFDGNRLRSISLWAGHYVRF